MESVEVICLQSSENEVIPVPYKLLKNSGSIRSIVELGLKKNNEVIKLSNIKSVNIRRIVEWLDHHKDDPETAGDGAESNANVLTPWDENFLKLSHEDLLEIALTAHYLEIKGLLRMTSDAYSPAAKGKAFVNLHNLFTYY